MFTAVGITDLGYRQVFAKVFKHNNSSSLIKFLRLLPKAEHYYSDEAPMYGAVLKTKVLQKKGRMTNLVESFNAQLRHYLSCLTRRTKCYAKSIESFQHTINLLLGAKFKTPVKIDYVAII